MREQMRCHSLHKNGTSNNQLKGEHAVTWGPFVVRFFFWRPSNNKNNKYKKKGTRGAIPFFKNGTANNYINRNQQLDNLYNVVNDLTNSLPC